CRAPADVPPSRLVPSRIGGYPSNVGRLPVTIVTFPSARSAPVLRLRADERGGVGVRLGARKPSHDGGNPCSSKEFGCSWWCSAPPRDSGPSTASACRP